MFGCPCRATNAKYNAHTNCKLCSETMYRRRFLIFAANAPEGIDSTKIGPKFANMSRPTKNSPPNRNASGPTTTVCIHDPMLEENVEKYNRRKSGCTSTARAVPGVG